MSNVDKIKLCHDDHSANLPTIRIAGIELNSFKSVKHGKIVFNCGKTHIPYGTKSDILGIYGQNGSGKTSVIEAIAILKFLLSGESIPDEYADCIAVNADYSELVFTLDIQYPDRNEYETNRDVRTVVYSFKLRKEKKEEVETPHLYSDAFYDTYLPVYEDKIVVYDEVIKMSGTVYGKKVSMKPYIDTTNEKNCFEPLTKARLLIGELDEEKRIEIEVNRRRAKDQARSFIFMPAMVKLFYENSKYSYLYQMIIELGLWGRKYLYVVDSRTTGLIRLKSMLPLFSTNMEDQLVPIGQPFTVDEAAFNDMSKCFDALSGVLSEIVPGLTVFVKDHGASLTDEGKNGRRVELAAKRGEIEIPLRGESDGVRKLLSTLNYLIVVYNQQSTTVAYDEFDSGIFEYMLGEILQVLQSSGQGQFIFTSHNMRPLEILKKESICFTTTDPNNRYVKPKGIGETNNLRRVYYREIVFHEHYDNLYTETKKHRIVSAMRQAGGR